jgi:hypothetical protein
MHFARGTGLVDGIVVTEPWLNMNSDCTRIKESPWPFVPTSAIMTSPSSAPGVLGADRADLPVLSLDANSDRGFSRFCPRPLPATELDGASSATLRYFCCWGPDTITSGKTGMLFSIEYARVSASSADLTLFRQPKWEHLHVKPKDQGVDLSL